VEKKSGKVRERGCLSPSGMPAGQDVKVAWKADYGEDSEVLEKVVP
jgi:hypothetical protein